jgi:hypothetical protein
LGRVFSSAEEGAVISILAYLPAILCLLSACAVIHADGEGNQHVFGLGDIEIRPEGRPDGGTAAAVTVRSLGLTLNLLEESSDFFLGYYRRTLSRLRNCGPRLPLICRSEGPPLGTAAVANDFASERPLPGGGKGYFGLLDVTIPVSGWRFSPAGSYSDFAGLGLGFTRDAMGLDFVLGYSHSTLTAVGNNVVVMLPSGPDDCRRLNPLRTAQSC